MSDRVGMVGLWWTPEAFRGRMWRRVDGAFFSPADGPGFVAERTLEAAARLVLDGLNLSESASRVFWSGAEADAAFERFAHHGPARMTDEIFFDRDTDGRVQGWAQRVDACGNAVCQAVLDCAATTTDVGRVIDALLSGAQPPAGSGDVSLAIATLLRWQAASPTWSDAAVAASLRASALRLEPVGMRDLLESTAATVERGDEQASIPAVEAALRALEAAPFERIG